MSEGNTRGDWGGTDLFAMPELSSAVHDLKSPLASLRQMALEIESGELTANEVALYAHRIKLTSERALRLASDVSRASRLEDALFDCEPINPIAVCDDIAAQMGVLYEAQGRRLEVSRRRPAPLAVANHELLRRVLINFTDNALHYAPESGVVQLDVRASRRGDRVAIGVRDYGPGVAADLWKRMTFSRPAIVGRRPESSGLGLYLSKQFAEAMGARVGITRHHNGASFYIELAGSTQTSLL